MDAIIRILIVDWDVHHGQGTQYMFYNDPRVLYFSIHRYERGKFWPNLRESDYDYIGDGEGKGYNVNVPLNQTGLGDTDYITMSPAQHRALAAAGDSVYYNASTWAVSRLAVDSVCAVVDSVCRGETTNGLAVVRPPGHHAERDHAKGFGFLNNVAVAARYAQRLYPHVTRVMIVDWDVHHGNGTQNMFYTDDSILYVSIHRFDHGYFYPCNAQADCTYVGEGAGKGFNINIAWNDRNKGDAEYIAAFQQVVLPVAYEFSPSLVLVSCGFDSGCGDPLGHLDVTPAGYAYMSHQLMALARGRLVLALEGGYNLNTIADSSVAVLATLLGGAPRQIVRPGKRGKQRPSVNTGAVASIKSTIKQLKPYWKCLQFSVPLPQLTKKESAGSVEVGKGDGLTAAVDELGDALNKSLTVNDKEGVQISSSDI